MQNYLVVSVVVSVIFLTVVPPPAGVAGVVFVSTVVVVSLVVLPSLVCDVFVSVLFSVVPFWLSQPMVNMPSTAIKTDAKRSFIFTPFPMTSSLKAQPCSNRSATKNRCGRTPAGIPPHRFTFQRVPWHCQVALYLVIRKAVACLAELQD